MRIDRKGKWSTQTWEMESELLVEPVSEEDDDAIK
jgi:hypothetical protein